MKTGFKKLFNKKKASNDSEETASPQENYTPMSTNSLYTLPANELVTIIFKFDQEVKNLNQELLSVKDQLQSSKSDLSKLQDESVLYKENRETLQLECNRLARELNEAVTSLDSRQAQLDLFRSQLASKDELVTNYKSRITELEKQNCDLQLSAMHLSAGPETEKFRAKLEESSKQEALVHDLNLKSKTLEAEITKLCLTVSDDKETIRMWRDKTNLFENARREAESELVKVKSEAEDLRSEKARLLFFKESADTEIRSLKESVNQKELRMQKKVGKVENLQSSLSEAQQQNSVLRYENDMIKKRFAEDLQVVQERAKGEKVALEVEFEGKVGKLNREIDGLKEAAKAGDEVVGRLKLVESENGMLAQQLTNTITDLHEKQRKINELTEENTKLVDSLENANGKRELARNEVFKLTQKFEILQKSAQSDSVKVAKKCSVEEISVLNAVKNELDPLYKSLINLISEVEKDTYKVKIVEFTTFEKKMNNFVMMLHEQIEDLQVEKSVLPASPQQVAKAVKGRTPIKLFSCISEQEDAPPRLIPRPKRPPQPVDNRMVLRRGSAN